MPKKKKPKKLHKYPDFLADGSPNFAGGLECIKTIRHNIDVILENMPEGKEKEDFIDQTLKRINKITDGIDELLKEDK